MSEDEEDFDDKTYSIIEMSGFVNAIADSVAREMEISNPKEVFDFISIEQIKGIIEESKIGDDNNDHPIINADIFIKIVSEVMGRVQNGALARLAADGFLECAWDEELNDMIFWLADDKKPNDKKRNT